MASFVHVKLVSSELQVSITAPSFVALHLSVSEIVQCVLLKSVYCCFTITTLCTTMFTIIILVGSIE